MQILNASSHGTDREGTVRVKAPDTFIFIIFPLSVGSNE